MAWKFTGSCGHVVDGFIMQIEEHNIPHFQQDPTQVITWEKRSLLGPDTETVVEVFQCPVRPSGTWAP